MKHSNPPAPINYHTNEGCSNGTRSSRDSYRSPRTSKDRQSSPSHSYRSRNRSRSPRSPRSRNHQNYHIEHEHHRNVERRSSDRNNHHGSVFDRMSSPPKQRRQGESSRRSYESNSNDTTFLRTIHGEAHSIPPLLRSDLVETGSQGRPLSRTLESDTRLMQRMPDNNYHRIVVEQDVRNFPLIEAAEMRDIRERLIAAETHCRGLHTTVRAYEREIQKLHQIVAVLADDFEVLLHQR